MTYVVTKNFYDLEDGRHFYRVGDVYPREGVEPSDARVELLSDKSYIKTEEDVAEAKVKSLEAMKKDELIALAEKRKVTFDSKATKAELIELLK